MTLSAHVTRIVLRDRFSGETEIVGPISFELEQGDTLGIVGESGSGKSMIASSIMGMLPSGITCEGSITFEAEDLLKASPERMRALRGVSLGMIFQEPMSALNPLMKIGDQIVEGLVDRGELKESEARARAIALLKQVDMPDPERRIDQYPHQLSGGQRQRVAISIALASDPKILIADEPTTALDVTVQAEVLDLIASLVESRKMSLILISHDLGVIARMCRRTLVMCNGAVMEQGGTANILAAPQSEYTVGLLDARPRAEDRDMAPTRGDFTPPVLHLEGVVMEYPSGNKDAFRAVDHVRLSIEPGEIVGLVGESGCGKSTLARIIMGLSEPTDGSVHFKGQNLYNQTRTGLRRLRSGFQMVFQDPRASLDPFMTVERIVAEPMGLMAERHTRAERRRIVGELLEKVGVSPQSMDRRPAEFSGGQRQRIAIARALVCRPSLIIADEPTSALDLTVQKQILQLLRDLRKDEGLAMLFITHSLSVVESLCDRVVVMQGGRFVEQADTTTLYAAPQTAYTQRLLASELRTDRPA